MIAVAVRTRRRLVRVTGPRPASRVDRLAGYPRVTTTVAALGAGLAAGVYAGPVAALLASVYAALGYRAWLRVRRGRARAQDWTVALDALAEVAADLRAGLPPDRVLASVGGRLGRVPLVRHRVGVAVRVAEATGAPLADLVDRLEVDLRGLARVRLTVAAHAAGTRATAALLGVLPVAGIGLGFGMGADPLRVLMHTPIGAACALGAVGFQLAGLAWTARLSRAPDGLT